MHFEIRYCIPCRYHRRASDLAAELRHRYDATVSLEEGKFGQFDVLLDGVVGASKGRFPLRVLKHGAPQQDRIIEAIESFLQR